MNILFDLVHQADINLFKQTIYRLKREGHNIIITLRLRGSILKIAKMEFPDFQILIVGRHRPKLVGKLISYINREISFYSILKKKQVNVAVCMGLTFGFACKIRHIPLIHHDDDPEYRSTFLLGNMLSTKNIVPYSVSPDRRNTINYKGYKELAYLHPKYFTPNLKTLDTLNLDKFKYIFIREIANISANYKNSNSKLLENLQYIHNLGYTVILSLEDKSKQSLYKDIALILSEPVDDLHSIIYYSKLVISSGDTMAREASLLGVPTIYSGGRSMIVNNSLIQLGYLHKIEKLDEMKLKIDKLSQETDPLNRRELMKNHIINSFDDLNQIFINQIITK